MAIERGDSFPRKGMNRDSHPSELKKEEYSYAMNAAISSDNGDGLLIIQNDNSNLKCTGFKEGFRVVGHKFDQNRSRTYFFLHNPSSGCSEIGYIDISRTFDGVEALERECNCDTFVKLEVPLEKQEQVSYCTYTTLLSDCCDDYPDADKCLNFDLNHPIHESNIEIKDEFSSYNMYFTDGLNPPRYIEINDIENLYQDDQPCDDPISTCLQCEKLKIFKPYNIPCLTPTVIESGGSLKAGTYEVTLAYSTQDGQELSDYQVHTNPIPIFDRNNRILSQPNLDYRTNFSIALEVENLDTKFDYFKVAVIRRDGLNGGQSQSVLGVFPITTSKFVVSSLIGAIDIELPYLLSRRPIYEKTNGLAAGNGYLFHYGLETQRYINLQPVVNLMGSFAKWTTYQTTEDAYQNGVIVSNYTGYMRDEVYPFGIKFFMDGGHETPLMPFVPRPPKDSELTEYVNEQGDAIVTDLNVDSIVANKSDCINSGRRYRWQFENTATVDQDPCVVPSDISTNDYTVQEESTCVYSVDNIPQPVDTVTSGQVSVPSGLSLVEYINNNTQEVLNLTDGAWAGIQAVLNGSYPDISCSPNFGDNCDTPVLLSTDIIALSAETTESVRVYQPENDYTPIQRPTSCSSVRIDSNGNPVNDTTFQTDYMDVSETVYTRPENTNDSCNFASTLIFPSATNPGYYLENAGQVGSDTNLVTTIPATPSGTDFRAFLHSNAIWFKIDFTNREKVVIQTSSLSTCQYPDDNNGTKIRLSFYSDCSGTGVPSYDTILNLPGTEELITLDASDFPSGEAFIALDSEIFERVVGANTVFTLRPPCSCIAITQLDAVYETEISFTNLDFGQSQTYQSTCSYSIPELDDCEPVPHRKGDFGYWESDLKYPCNPELWDSSDLNILPSDIPVDLQNSFEVNYVDQSNPTDSSTGFYNLEDSANLQDKNIRHYKFPCSNKVPFMSEVGTSKPEGFAPSIIYPIGFSISNEVISSMLDVAVRNGLITAEERSKINKYEIYRGSRTSQKSIVAKGIVFDYLKYDEQNLQNDTAYYPNYPLNTKGQDVFNGNFLPAIPTINNLFAFHSPDTHFYKPTLPREMKLEGYMFGVAGTQYDIVLDHPKFTVLGQTARNLADTLATAEQVFEAFLFFNDIVKEGFGSNFGSGSALSLAYGLTVAAGYAAASAFQFGKNREQWLDSFRKLGNPKQFAYYSASIGYYNSFDTNIRGNSLYRGLSASQYVEEGRWKLNNSTGAGVLNVNNEDRENHVMINTSPDFPIYDTQAYYNYDNYDSNKQNSTRREGVHKLTGKSGLYESNTAVPYVSLKNYLPSQYGTIDSIGWLSTNYCGDLNDTQNDCSAVFGGDVYISRFSVKRKFPFFTSTAIGLPDNTPFEYSRYFNIPVAVDDEGVQDSIQLNRRFYMNYLIDSSSGGALSTIFPTDGTDYKLDFQSTNNKFYEGPPSKFYLFSFGIPHFLVESTFNCNFRYSGTELSKDFYPHKNDIIELTQPVNVPLSERESFLINDVYFFNKTLTPYTRIPESYSKAKFDLKSTQENGISWSKIDSSGTDVYDPWLIYRPLDSTNYDKANGKLIDVSLIENRQMLARFKNGMAVFGAVDQIADRFETQTPDLGAGGIFRGRNMNYYKTDLGYAGTQNVAMVSCKFGHFWADAKRGKVFQMEPSQSGSMPIEITQGLQKWFKENLPFKALSIPGITEDDIDNPYNGIGLSMGWDDRNDRVFLTKKDYKLIADCPPDYQNVKGQCIKIPTRDCINNNEVVNGDFKVDLSSWTFDIGDTWVWFNGQAEYQGSNQGSTLQQSVFTVGETYTVSFDICVFGPPLQVNIGGNNFTYSDTGCYTVTETVIPTTTILSFYAIDGFYEIDNVCAVSGLKTQGAIDFTDTDFFEDCSWTVAYSPLTKSWISYYSFKPNYYIGYNNYFQTGITDVNGSTLWSHVPFNSSYQVYYGNLHPFTIEYPLISKGAISNLRSIDYWMDVRKYYNKNDYADIVDNGFNKAVVYKNDQSTGQLELVKQNNNDLSQMVNYPKHKTNSTEVLQSEIGGKWSFNYLYNRVRNEKSGLPLWLYDCANVDKTLNHKLINYKNSYQDRLRGDYFSVRLTQDANSRFKYIFRYSINERNYYYQ